MPTYVYDCPRCGRFETRQAISEPALDRCPTCGESIERQVAGGTSFIIKGSGAARSSRCEREVPCCGRATRCDRPPCG
jgi:putative FmdB family regulatory protein